MSLMRNMQVAAVLTVVMGFAVPAGAQNNEAAQRELAKADKADKVDQDAGKARGHFEQAIQHSPAFVPPGAYARLAQLIAQDPDKYEDSLKVLAKGEGYHAGHPELYNIQETRAYILVQMGQMARGAEEAEKVVAVSPTSFVAQKIIGDFSFDQGIASAEKTIEAYDAYLSARPTELAPADKIVITKLAFAYLRARNDASAKENFVRAMSQAGPPYLDYNARKGLCAADTRLTQWEEAKIHCTWVKDNPMTSTIDPATHYNLARIALGQSMLTDARQEINEFIRLSPRRGEGYELRGDVYFADSKWDAAEADYLEAEKLDPTLAGVVPKLGQVYVAQKQFEKAIARLTVALEQRPEDADLIHGLGYAHLNMGDSDKASELATRGLEIAAAAGDDRGAVRFHVLKGDAEYSVGVDFQLALASYRQALTLDETHDGAQQGAVRTLGRLAQSEYQAGNRTGARDFLESALRIRVEDSDTNFNLGLIHADSGQYAEATPLLEKAVGSSKDNLDRMQRVLARSYAGEGKDREALAAYVQAEKLATASQNNSLLVEIYVDSAPLLIKAERTADAINQLKKAVAMGKDHPALPTAERTLELAYFKRGLESVNDARWDTALSNLKRVQKSAVLTEDQAAVRDFAMGFANLNRGRASQAQKFFADLKRSTRGGRLTFLKDPYDKIGLQLFSAYAAYRQGIAGNRNALRSAANDLEKLHAKSSGKLKRDLGDLLRSTLEFTAIGEFKRRKNAAAEAALKKATRYATAQNRRVIDHNLAVLGLKGKGTQVKDAFRKLGPTPPESLINLGIILNNEGDHRGAYDAWVKARRAGARSPGLDKWIETKRNIFGFQ